MSAQPSSVLVLTGAFGRPLNAANTGAGTKNPDGSTNVSGTVIGIAQTTHSMIDFATLGSNVGKWLPGAGAVIGVAGVYDSWGKINKALQDGTPVQQSDIAGLIGSAATVIGAGALLITSSGVVVPVTAVAGIAAGTYQLMATAGGWTIGSDGKPVNMPLTTDENLEIAQTLRQAQQTGVTPQLDTAPILPAALGTAARDSASYFTSSGADSITVKSGGTLSDIWWTQRNAANGFANDREFYAAVMACNPAITDVNSIQAGQTLYLPQKLADGSITYHHANGASINSNAATGEYTMLIPDAEGGQTVYERTLSADGNYFVRQATTDSAGNMTDWYTGYLDAADNLNSEQFATTDLSKNLTQVVNLEMGSVIGQAVIQGVATGAQLEQEAQLAAQIAEATSLSGALGGAGVLATLDVAASDATATACRVADQGFTAHGGDSSAAPVFATEASYVSWVTGLAGDGSAIYAQSATRVAQTAGYLVADPTKLALADGALAVRMARQNPTALSVLTALQKVVLAGGVLSEDFKATTATLLGTDTDKVETLIIDGGAALCSILAAFENPTAERVAGAAISLLRANIPISGELRTMVGNALNVDTTTLNNLLAYGGAGLAVISVLKDPTPQNIVNASANDGAWQRAA